MNERRGSTTRAVWPARADLVDYDANQRRVLAAIDLHWIDVVVTGLPGDRGAVGTVADALGDESGAEGVSAEFGQRGGVLRTVLDHLAAHGPLLIVVDQPNTIGALPAL